MVEQNKGIEITAKDLIKRPLDMALGGAKTGQGALGGIKSVQDIIKEVKATIDLLKGIPGVGERLEGILPGLTKGGKPGGSPGKEVATTQGGDFQMLVQLLQLKYGDVTVNEALERLKADFGGAKLSQLTRGFTK